MATVALISKKGGSGKSTLATHLAAHYARQGLAVTLGDLDPQQSTRVWLKRRPSAAPSIAGWVADAAGTLRPPTGAAHLVLDTPGGLHGLTLAKVIMSTDLVLVPVASSVFDREAAADCWAQLRAQPRVANGRCAVAAVGMRLDRRTHAEDTLRDWAASVDLPLIACLRSTQLYVRAVENGLSIFDMPLSVSAADRAEWAPMLAWVESKGFGQALDTAPSGLPMARSSLAPATVLPLRAPVATPAVKPSESLRRFVPRFLQRTAA